MKESKAWVRSGGWLFDIKKSTKRSESLRVVSVDNLMEEIEHFALYNIGDCLFENLVRVAGAHISHEIGQLVESLGDDMRVVSE